MYLVGIEPRDLRLKPARDGPGICTLPFRARNFKVRLRPVPEPRSDNLAIYRHVDVVSLRITDSNTVHPYFWALRKTTVIDGFSDQFAGLKGSHFSASRPHKLFLIEINAVINI